jgi:hypothetical protein
MSSLLALTALQFLTACDSGPFAGASYQGFKRCVEENSVDGLNSIRSLCASKHEIPLKDKAIGQIWGGSHFNFLTSDQSAYAEEANPNVDDWAYQFAGEIRNETHNIILTSYKVQVTFNDGTVMNGVDDVVLSLAIDNVWVEPGGSDFFLMKDIGELKGVSRDELGPSELPSWRWEIIEATGLEF